MGDLVHFVHTEELSCPIFALLFASELECIYHSCGLLGTLHVYHSTLVTFQDMDGVRAWSPRRRFTVA